MTIEKLFEICEEQIKLGHGKVRVLFDTEARTFDTHMVEVTGAFFEEEPEQHLGLHFINIPDNNLKR